MNTLEHYDDDDLLYFFEQYIRCDQYCPVKCDHHKLAILSDINELKDEIILRMRDFSKQKERDWNN